MKEYIPDCLFPSDNELEVPSLLPDVQPEFCEIPFVCWGETARTFQMNGNGTLHFYTDDYRFNAVFEHPEKILQMNPAKEFARRNRCVYVEQLVNVKNKMKSLDRQLARIQETIAFPDEDISAIVSRKAEVKQLFDYTAKK